VEPDRIVPAGEAEQQAANGDHEADEDAELTLVAGELGYHRKPARDGETNGMRIDSMRRFHAAMKRR
jgi:hypothetical protein